MQLDRPNLYFLYGIDIKVTNFEDIETKYGFDFETNVTMKIV